MGIIPRCLTRLFSRSNGLSVYGTPGNGYGNIMLGGEDVEMVNAMLQKAFDEGRAGVGDATVQIGEYKGRSVHEQKAADEIRISLDEKGHAYVKLIVRGKDPGMGLLALAGGFKEAGETDEETAKREGEEEAREISSVLPVERLNTHSIDRHPVKGDVRVWGGSDRADGVKKGDIIALSTAATVYVVRNGHGVVEAGDDAAYAGWVALSDIDDANLFGIKGHAEMLLKATELAGLQQQLPESFTTTLNARKEDIIVAKSDMSSEALAKLTLDQ